MEATATTSSSGSKATGKNTFTAGFGGAQATSTGSSSAAVRVQDFALGLGRAYGMALVLLGVTLGFIVML